jgi:hypothetical protein
MTGDGQSKKLVIARIATSLQGWYLIDPLGYLKQGSQISLAKSMGSIPFEPGAEKNFLAFLPCVFAVE